MCTCTQSSRYSQSASLPAHNQITAPQFIRRNLHSSWYKQIPTHCLLLFTIEAGDLLDLVKNTMKDTKKIEKNNAVFAANACLTMIWMAYMPPDKLRSSYSAMGRQRNGLRISTWRPIYRKKRRFRASESCYFAVFLLCLSWFWRGQETNNT